ncbi:MAG TPA: helix-turn-helix domain-containing protein [Candidatus Tectomicrobia bacterium]|nr:helix-turn-helix domain-containing protein [Candidatus Tectomicrobia bacterium]
MNAPVSLRARRAARTREALLDAAAREIGRRGYAAATIDAIAAAAGLTKGAFYTHFEDKAALLREVVARWTEDRARRLASARTFWQAVAAFVEYSRGPTGAPLAAELWRRSLWDAQTRCALRRAYTTWSEALERLAAFEPDLQASPRDAALAALAFHDGVVAGACARVRPPTAPSQLVESLRRDLGSRRTA